MPKVHVDQGNLFGGCGQVTHEQIARAGSDGTTMGYLKCACGRVSQPVQIPNSLLGPQREPGPCKATAARDYAHRVLGWSERCPDCQKAAA